MFKVLSFQEGLLRKCIFICHIHNLFIELLFFSRRYCSCLNVELNLLHAVHHYNIFSDHLKIFSGRRVMGMVTYGAMSTLIAADSYLLWDIPDCWTMEQAATIPVVYGTVIYALILVRN